jgi:predicted extracellular nuclease
MTTSASSATSTPTKEDPIDALLAGAYTDLVRRYEGEFAYSFVFDGQLGYLDHALAGSRLVDEVTGATEWHINADEPDLLDYDMTFKQPAQKALFERTSSARPTTTRSSWASTPVTRSHPRSSCHRRGTSCGRPTTST